MTQQTLHGSSALHPASQQNTIVLFGEVLADMFPDRTVLGGAPFNVARHLKAFGQNPVLITRLGNDALRDKVLNVMTENGMETLGIQLDKKHPTGRVQVHIEKAATVSRFFPCRPTISYTRLWCAWLRFLCNPALVYFGTLAQRHEVSRQALKTLLRSTNAARFLDINLRAPWYDEKTLCAIPAVCGYREAE